MHLDETHADLKTDCVKSYDGLSNEFSSYAIGKTEKKQEADMEVDQAEDPGEENQGKVNFASQQRGLGGRYPEDVNVTGKGGGNSKSF